MQVDFDNAEQRLNLLRMYMYYIFYNITFYLDQDPEVTRRDEGTNKNIIPRSFHGSFLPLVFGLPFAPELDTPFMSFSSQEATLSQELITFTANFAASG